MANKKYIVVKKGITLGLGDDKKSYNIGDELKLSDKQAANLVGKIRKASDYVDDGKSDTQLKAENVKLGKSVDELQAKLSAGVDDLQGELAESDGKVAMLEKENKKLVKENKELTKSLTSLTEKMTAAK